MFGVVNENRVFMETEAMAAALRYATELAKMGIIPREQDAILSCADNVLKKYFNHKQ